jgi:hypothetical protein
MMLHLPDIMKTKYVGGVYLPQSYDKYGGYDDLMLDFGFGKSGIAELIRNAVA